MGDLVEERSAAHDPAGDGPGGDPGDAFGGAGSALDDGEQLSIDPASYPDLSAAQAMPGEPRDLRLLSDIELELCVEIGRARLPLRQLLALTPGSVVELDRALGEPVDVLVNGKLVARGQIVTIADEFGVRLSEIIDPSAAAPQRRRN
jgi:flagellar motor switch protein FliN/FliY